MAEQLTKDSDVALVEIRELLYDRLKNRTNYAAQNPIKDPYYKGLQKGEFLKSIIALIERD